MNFFKQLFRFLIVNIVLFIFYLIGNTFFMAVAQSAGLANPEVIYDIIMSVLTWAGFLALHIFRITDRRGYGIYYLYSLEKNPAPPSSAFNIFTDWKRNNWETLSYLAMIFVTLTAYAKVGAMTWATPSVLTEIFLPQTLFFKLTGSPLWGLLLTVGIFYSVTALVQISCRKRWLETPLSDDERMLVDPEWQPAEMPAEESAELPAEEKAEEEK